MDKGILGLLVSGLALVVAGVVLLAAASLRAGGGSGSFIVVIGPLPIVGAWGPHGVALAAIGALLLVLILLAHLILLRRRLE